MIDLNELSQAHLANFNKAIAQWIRLSGSEEELASARYVESELKAAGFATQLILHPAYISLPGAASLKVTSPTAHDLFCITHSMGIPTPAGGRSAELVFVGNGTAAEYAKAGAAGKMALVDGRATPAVAVNATKAGVLGVVCISGKHAHEMCCSPIWGNPSESTAANLPHVHLLSVHKADGEGLRDLCQKGKVEIQFSAEVQTKWTRTPIVVGDLAAGHPEADPAKFVLFSGHLDSWYVGAMDNGSANAAMLELARVMAPHRAEMRRAVRICFWSGHSHGRYSSSAWYADNHWVDLAENCVIHLNADSLGGVGANNFTTNSMPETYPLGAWAVEQVTGQKLGVKRVGRDSDQSFTGIGLPTLLGSVSRQADASLGWWWHTPYDTLDKIDLELLVRDTKIFALTLNRVLADPVLPLDYAASAADLVQSLETLANTAGAAFDLGPALAEAGRLEALTRRLHSAAGKATGAAAHAINQCLQDLGRTLIPVTYTSAGRYTHDPALERHFLPKLQGLKRLGALDPHTDAAHLLQVDLVRARNELTGALRQACASVESCLGRVS